MTDPRRSGVFLTVAGVVGIAASFTLTVERFRLLTNPDYVPSCSINPVLSCGSVMTTPQAAAFGFPNPVLGLIGFTVVGLTGVLLLGSVRIPGWYFTGLAATTIAATGFVHWLIFQSLYRIGALCPYCMVVWATLVPTLAVVAKLALPRPPRGLRPVIEWRWIIVAAWFALVTVLIYLRFDAYWNSLI